MQIHDPALKLPYLEMTLSVAQVRRELNKATVAFRRLQKQSTLLRRLQCYEDLLEAVYQDDKNPETMVALRKKRKSL